MDIAEKVLRAKTDLDEVYEAGKKAEYDELWDSFEHEWEMMYRFAGVVWNDTTFKPKYDIVVGPYNCTGLFMLNRVSNLKQILLNCGVRLDLSKCVNFLNGFRYSHITTLPEIDLSNSDNVDGCFADMTKLKSIDKVTFKDGINFNVSFSNVTELEEIRIGGTISGNGFNVSWSTFLTHDSLMSIINALADKSGTGTTFTITLGTENLAKLTDAEKAIATQKGWSFG